MGMGKLSPIDKWWRDFARDPSDAIERLLMRKVYMGRLHPNSSDEIIFRLFHRAGSDKISCLDGAMRAFFEKYWGMVNSPDPQMPQHGWQGILRDAFFAVHRLKLEATQSWLSKQEGS